MLPLHDPSILWFAVAAVVALLIALALVLRARAAETRRRDRFRAPDVLDEGAAPAARNTALIAAPSAAARVAGPIVGAPAAAPEPLPRTAITAERAAGLADTGPGIIGGIGSVIAAAAASESEAGHAAAQEAGLPDSAEDDLTRIKGLGPKLRARLSELGVTRFAQIAAWTDTDIATIDAQLGAFAGRATRDNWVAQAAFLAAGDIAGYEAQFGKL